MNELSQIDARLARIEKRLGIEAVDNVGGGDVALPLPDIDTLTFRGGWSVEYDKRSGGRIPSVVYSLRERAKLTPNINIRHWLLDHPLLRFWTIAVDTPWIEDDPEAEFQRLTNAGPLDDLIIPGGGGKPGVNIRVDWRQLTAKEAVRYERGPSGTPHNIGSWKGTQVFEMSATSMAEALSLFVDAVIRDGIPPPVDFDADFRGP